MEEFKPKWLEQIQNGSWEPELFISGGAIFTLLKLPVLIHNYSILGWQESAYHEPILIAQFFSLAANGLIVGFILHLILRGFWIASVCLSFVFPDGINQKRMQDYVSPFREKLEKLPSPIKVVTTMETVCSVVFSLSFLFFLLIVGLLVFFMILIPHSGLENVIGGNGFFIVKILSFIGIVVLGGIYLIDFLTLGFIKKQKSIAKFYYPIYRIYSFLTLSFLYRSAYYTFITNTKKWKVLLAIFFYLAISFAATSITNPLASAQNKAADSRIFLQGATTQNTHQLHYYEDKRQESQLIESASIQSEIIEANFLRLFIVHYKAFEPFITKSCNINEKEIKLLTEKDKLQCLGNFYQIGIGKKQIENIKWKYYNHPETSESGILAFIPLKNIVSGENTLTISLNIEDKSKAPNVYRLEGYDSNHHIEIPFWKE